MSESEKAVVDAITALMAALGPLDEEARVHVLEFVVKRLGIKLQGQTIAAASTPISSDLAATPPAAAAPAAPPPAPHPSSSVDIRSFAKTKNPKTASERIAVIAFWLAHEAPPAERKDQVTWDEIEPYFRQAGLPLPTASSMALTNAKNAGFLNAVDRGQFKLNTVGHNLVTHKLPDGDGSKGSAVRKKSKKPKRKT